MSGNCCEGLDVLGVNLAALVEQRDDLRGLAANLEGSGVIARGKGAEAAGQRAIVADTVQKSTLITGDQNRIVHAGKYIEHQDVYNQKEASFYDPAKALEIYCSALFKMERYLPLRGIDLEAVDSGSKQQRMNLANVYIDLNTKTQIDISGADKKGAGKYAHKTDRDRPEMFSEKDKTRPLRAIEAAARNRTTVLLGDPGSGKTTFVNHLTFCLAAHRLEPFAGWLDRLPGWPETAAEAIHPSPCCFVISPGGWRVRGKRLRRGICGTLSRTTFQEYMAGAYLSTKPDFTRQATIFAEENSFWREVILLAVGRLVYVSGELDKATVLANELCPAKPEDGDTGRRKAWLAGEVLLEIGLNRVQDSFLGKELAERVPSRLVPALRHEALSPVERGSAGRVLTKVGDPRTEVLLPEQMEFCESGRGVYHGEQGRIQVRKERANATNPDDCL